MCIYYAPKAYAKQKFAYYLVMSRHMAIQQLLNLFAKESDAILDLGCGVGEYLRNLTNTKLLVGLDSNHMALQKRSSDFWAVQGDAQRLPLQTETFDLVLFSEVLEHLPNPGLALDEIRRVMNKKAVLILSTPLKRSFYERHCQASIIGNAIFLMQKVLHRPSSSAGQDDPDYHRSLLESEQLNASLKHKGFVILDEQYIGFCLPLSFEILNFLFQSREIVRFYMRLDSYMNRSRIFRNLNWIMIFACQKLT